MQNSQTEKEKKPDVLMPVRKGTTMSSVYQSTRNPELKATSKEAVLKGLAPDGGLYVWPELDEEKADLEKVCAQNYQENAEMILSILLPDYTPEEIHDCVSSAYTGTFDVPEMTPVKEVDGVQVLELFHGPTSAFKDMALTMLPHLMRTALAEQDKKAMILTATSGDTGKAALAGFQDVDGTAICVFYPKGKVSDIQYRQMATQKGNNVNVFAVEGNFDDCQSRVKELFMDPELNEFAEAHNISLSSANSINIGRLVPQVVYYFDAYAQLVRSNVIQMGDEVSFSVPTGNFGDVLAGYYAYLLGLPVKKFYVASNANNVLTDFIETGVYDKNRPFIKTISPSMDILISSNLERFLYFLSGKDADQVAAWMKQLAEEGRYDIGKENLEKMQALFGAEYLDDEQTKQVIHDVYKKTGYVLDPHTAIGYAAAAKHKDDGVIVALSTASPYKFSADVLDALQKEAGGEWEALHRLDELNADPVPEKLAELESLEILHNTDLIPETMKQAVMEACLRMDD